MSNDLAYAMFLIYQRLARDIGEQQRIQQLFFRFVGGGMSADDYERDLAQAAPGRILHAR